MKLCIRSLKILLLAVLLLSLCACAASPAPDPNAGLYLCMDISSSEESFAVEELYPQGCTLELRDGGEAELNINGSIVSANWEIKGDSFILKPGPLTCTGSFNKGYISIALSDDGLVHHFLLSGAEAPEPMPEETDLPGSSLWNGDWYGYWQISDAQGVWAELNGQRFDLFAGIELDENGEGSLTLWDERLSRSEPMAELIIGTDSNEVPLGTATVLGGYFWLMEPTAEQWRLSADEGSLLSLESAHYETAEGSFTFSLYLKPWGWLWDEGTAEAPLPMPYFYHDWYLPLIEQSAPMPDSFSPPPAALGDSIS